ncbi:MAG TPA: AI-2E family transporter [Solirubrobacterales bacterium]|nr:AI-2E family transporter [Solirubrobacterales bacterium]
MIRGRIKHQRKSSADAESAPPDVVEIDPGELSGIFRVPDWLRDIGLMAWLLVGVALLLGALVWLASLTQVIVIPVLTAAIIAVVAIPLVTWLEHHRVPRGLGALLVMLGIVLVAVGMGVAIVVSITGEASNIAHQLNSAKDDIAGWLKDLGVTTEKSKQTASSLGTGSSDAVNTLLSGVVSGLSALSGLVFFMAMAALSTFFLLKDGPVIRAWTEDHSGLPGPVTRVITQRAIGSLRGYFLGTTIVAVFSAVVVGIGSVIIGVPYIAAIVGVTFIAGYIPYIGAWAAGAFTVLLALGSDGMTAAAAMIVVQVLANGVLQQFIQPFAMGAALGIHPLVVLVVTIAGGALFGAMGLILAAPVVSAIVGISHDLAQAKAEGEAEAKAAAAAASPAVSSTG